MNLLKKTCLTLTPFLLSALLMTSAAAATSMVENTGNETPEDASLRITTAYNDFIGSWNAIVQKGQIESPEKFSFLPGGVLLHSGSPIVIDYNLQFNNGHGAWEQDKEGNFIIHYYRSSYLTAGGTYFDDEEVTGKLSFDENRQLVGELTIGMVSEGDAPSSDIKVKFTGTRIHALKPKKTAE